MTIQLLLLLEALGFLVAFPLLGLYLKERVTNLARQRTDEALADYQHRYDRLLSQLQADNQRRLHEFSLFAEKQHRVYGALYRKAREATDRYSAYFGISMSPSFDRHDLEAANEYFASRNVLKVDSTPILRMFDDGELEQARKALSELDRKVAARDAGNAFSKMKNLEAMYELYLSDEVRANMERVREHLAACSVVAMRPDTVTNEALAAKVENVDSVTAALFHAMRREIYPPQQHQEQSTAVTRVKGA